MTGPKKARLGKGLSALLGEYLPEEGTPAGETGGLRVVPVSRITANPFQPRREFSPEELAELEASIRENGLLQPLVVRPASPGAPEGAEWELVAGERRWRAVRRLGWTEVPAIVKEIDDRAMLVLAIVENVQRARLSAMEEAAGYRQLIDEFGFTQQEVAEAVGKNRSTVANLLRLLQLPASVQRMVADAELEVGHAKVLLGLESEREMADLAREAAAGGLTVRQVEDRVRERRAPAPPRSRSRKRPDLSPHLRHLEEELQRALGTEARIRVGRGTAGRVEIPFFSADDFDRVMELLLGAEAGRT